MLTDENGMSSEGGVAGTVGPLLDFSVIPLLVNF